MISESKLSILQCPACKGDLAQDGSYLVCTGCSSRFPVVDDIVVLLTKDDLAAFLSETWGSELLKDCQNFRPEFTFPSNEDELDALQKSYKEITGRTKEDEWFMDDTPVADPDLSEEYNAALSKSRDDIVRLAKAGSANRVLDWPTGAGYCLKHLIKQVGPETLVVALDISFRTMAAIKPYYDEKGFSDNMLFVIADARNMPFKDNTFQAATVRGALEIERPHDGFRETFRVLSEDGWVATSGDQYKEGSPSMEIAERLGMASLATRNRLESAMTPIGFKNMEYEVLYEAYDTDDLDTSDEYRCPLPARGDLFQIMVAAAQK